MLSPGENFDEEQGICMVLMSLLKDSVFIAKEKILTTQWENLSDQHLTINIH